MKKVFRQRQKFFIPRKQGTKPGRNKYYGL